MKICDLDQTEQQISWLLIQESTVPAIAIMLNKRLGTMKSIISSIYKKLGVSGKIGLIKKYYQEEIEDLLKTSPEQAIKV